MDPSNRDELIEALQTENQLMKDDLNRAQAKINELQAELKTYFGAKSGAEFELLKQTNLVNIQLIDSISFLWESSQKHHDKSVKQANRWIENLRQTATRINLPPYVAAIVNIAHKQLEVGVKNLEQSLKHINENLGLNEADLKDPDLSVDSRRVLEQAKAFLMAAAINDNTVGLLTQAHYLAGDPPYVAFEILWELENDSLSLTTLKRLPSDWIKENLVNKPKTKLLHEGLKSAWDQSQSGKTQKQFCKERLINERNFRYHSSWLKQLQKIAIPPSELFKTPD